MMLMLKGRGLPVGTIREWNGVKHRKTGSGAWVRVAMSRPTPAAPREALNKNILPSEKPKQPVVDLEGVYRLVEGARRDFNDWTGRMSEKFKDSLVEVRSRKELKKRDRAARKITPEEGADSILDIDGKTMIFLTERDVLRAARYLKTRPEVVRIKDRFATPTNVGYRDFLMNVKMPNGAVVELQISTQAMMSAKAHGHLFYEISDQVETAYKNNSLSAELFSQIREFSANTQKSLYDSAAQAGLTGASFNAASLDIGTALRSISETVQLSGASLSVLSEKTRNSLSASLSKATMVPSQSKKRRLRLSKSIKTPLLPISISPVRSAVNEPVALIIKAKPYPDGTVRTHGGHKVRKENGGWVPVSEGMSQNERAEAEAKAPKKKTDKLKIKGSPEMYETLRQVAENDPPVYLDDVRGKGAKIYNYLTKNKLVTWTHVANDEYRCELTEIGKKAINTGEALEVRTKREAAAVDRKTQMDAKIAELFGTGKKKK